MIVVVVVLFAVAVAAMTAALFADLFDGDYEPTPTGWREFTERNP